MLYKIPGLTIFNMVISIHSDNNMIGVYIVDHAIMYLPNIYAQISRFYIAGYSVLAI